MTQIYLIIIYQQEIHLCSLLINVKYQIYRVFLNIEGTEEEKKGGQKRVGGPNRGM